MVRVASLPMLLVIGPLLVATSCDREALPQRQRPRADGGTVLPPVDAAGRQRDEAGASDAGGTVAPTDGSVPDREGSGDPAERAVEGLRQAGYQYGLELCRCLLPGATAPQLDSCAQAESGPAEILLRDSGERCALELARSSEVIRSYLTCTAAFIERVTACWRESCPKAPEVSCGGPGCTPLPQALQVQWHSCANAYYCGDTRSDSMRCNNRVECPDLSDERGCPGNSILCADKVEVVHHLDLCDGRADCPDGADERFCAPPDPLQRPLFLCANGATLPTSFVCDGKRDCPDGRDELSCLPP